MLIWTNLLQSLYRVNWCLEYGYVVITKFSILNEFRSVFIRRSMTLVHTAYNLQRRDTSWQVIDHYEYRWLTKDVCAACYNRKRHTAKNVSGNPTYPIKIHESQSWEIFFYSNDWDASDKWKNAMIWIDFMFKFDEFLNVHIDHTHIHNVYANTHIKST